MDDKKYDIRKPIDTPANYRMAMGLFALLGAGFIAVAIYYYVRLTEWEQNGGYLDWWRGFSQLYQAYGKWGVVTFNLVVALIFFTVSWFSLRKWRQLVRAENSRKENTDPAENEL